MHYLLENIEYDIVEATKEDLKDILQLQKSAFIMQAEIYDDYSIPPLQQTYSDLEEEFTSYTFLKVVSNSEIIGSLRYIVKDEICHVEKVIVHPRFQNRGIGSSLLKYVEDVNSSITKFQLFTGSKSEGNIFLYQRHGYEITSRKRVSQNITLLFMEKDLKKPIEQESLSEAL